MKKIVTIRIYFEWVGYFKMEKSYYEKNNN